MAATLDDLVDRLDTLTSLITSIISTPKKAEKTRLDKLQEKAFEEEFLSRYAPEKIAEWDAEIKAEEG